MNRFTAFLFFFFLLWGVMGSSAQAVWLELTPEQVQQAVTWGKDQLKERIEKKLPIDEYEKEWDVNLGTGKGSAYLNTLFALISYESRKYAGINMELPQGEVNSFIERFKNKLYFTVTLYGKEKFFPRKYKMVLRASEKEIQPIYKDVFQGRPSKLGDPEAAYEAPYVVEFPAEEIDPQSQVTLVALGPEGKEIHFPFDLSRMR